MRERARGERRTDQRTGRRVRRQAGLRGGVELRRHRHRLSHEREWPLSHRRHHDSLSQQAQSTDHPRLRAALWHRDRRSRKSLRGQRRSRARHRPDFEWRARREVRAAAGREQRCALRVRMAAGTRDLWELVPGGARHSRDRSGCAAPVHVGERARASVYGIRSTSRRCRGADSRDRAGARGTADGFSACSSDRRPVRGRSSNATGPGRSSPRCRA